MVMTSSLSRFLSVEFQPKIKFQKQLCTYSSNQENKMSMDKSTESQNESKNGQCSRRSNAMKSMRKRLRAMSLSTLRSGEESPKSLSRESSCRVKNSPSHSPVTGDGGELPDFEPIKDMSAYYLKYHEARSPGLDEIIETANKIYNHHKPYMRMREKSLISIDSEGIRIKETVAIKRSERDIVTCDVIPEHAETTVVDTLYRSRRIVYCGVDKLHQKVFVFNYQYAARPENIHIHVILCKTKDDAKSIAKALKKIFKNLSKESHQTNIDIKREHAEELNKLITKSNQSLQNSTTTTSPTANQRPHAAGKYAFRSMSSPSNSSKESCAASASCGSGEPWQSDNDGTSGVCLSIA